VLAVFVTTTAIPGRQVIVHSHADGDHEHTHASLAHEALAPHDHDDDHHHRHHDDEAALPLDDHRLGLTHPDDDDPLHHTHVTSPFQPATPPAPLTVEAVALVTAQPESGLRTPPDRSVARARSRGPPRLHRV
jgi:hypothetical protein